MSKDKPSGRRLKTLAIGDVKTGGKFGREHFTDLPALGKSIRVRLLSAEQITVVPYHLDVPIKTPKQKKTIYIKVISPGEAEAKKVRCPLGGVLSDYETKESFRMLVWNYDTNAAEIMECGPRILNGIKEIAGDDDLPDILEMDIKVKGVDPSSK